MSNTFNKDAWILRAIDSGALRPMKSGAIFRPGSKGLVPVKFSTHAPTGRVYFTLSYEGISKSVLVNRVLALAFLPNPLNLPQVNHIDGHKDHNWIERFDVEPRCNLEWSTKADNERHAHGTGLKTSRGTSNGNSKLTPADVQNIRQAPKASLRDLAQSLNVSTKTLDDIRARKTWRHL